LVAAFGLGQEQVYERVDVGLGIDAVVVDVDAGAIVRRQWEAKETPHEAGDIETVEDAVAIDVARAFAGGLDAIAADRDRAISVLD
jgi:hypothetical protein